MLCSICMRPVDPDGSEGVEGKIIPMLIHRPVDDTDESVEDSIQADNDHRAAILRFDDLFSKVIFILPNAEFGEDLDGQIIVYTNLTESEWGSTIENMGEVES